MSQQRIAIKLTKAAEKQIKRGHPWVFDESIIKQNKEGQAGDLAIIFDQTTNGFIALGLYDPKSHIRVKVLSNENGTTLDFDWFKKVIEAASVKRQPLLDITDAYRLINGENDGLPGLICDRYDDAFVIKIYSHIWKPYIDWIVKAIVELFIPEAIILRRSRKLSEDLGENESKIIYGKFENPEIIFTEFNIKLSANLLKGHKTGFFLDHRQNRIETQKLSNGKRVLDVFSYAGGFTCHALKGGAAEVTSLDISHQALMQAKKNVALNFESANHTCLPGDAFKVLEELYQQKKKYDLIIIDPPSFTSSIKQKEIALKKYKTLTKLGLKLLSKNGILMMASCSSRVGRSEFFDAIENELYQSKRKFNCLKKTYHDIDHPTLFKEAEYLKCGWYAVH